MKGLFVVDNKVVSIGNQYRSMTLGIHSINVIDDGMQMVFVMPEYIVIGTIINRKSKVLKEQMNPYVRITEILKRCKR